MAGDNVGKETETKKDVNTCFQQALRNRSDVDYLSTWQANSGSGTEWPSATVVLEILPNLSIHDICQHMLFSSLAVKRLNWENQ